MKHVLILLCASSSLLFSPSVSYSGRLTKGNSAKFSPDGKRLVFVYGGHICVIGKDGKHRQQLTKLTYDQEPTWSHDGKKIAFASYGKKNKYQDDKFSVWIMNSNGTNFRQLTKRPSAVSDDQLPYWSPDGKQIVWTHGKQLWIMDSSGQNAHPLTTQPARDWEYVSDWSAKNNLIVYIGSDSSGDYSPKDMLRSIRPTGEDQRVLIKNFRGYGVKWSSDGKHIFYGDGNAILRIDSAGKEDPQEVFSVSSSLWNGGMAFDISPDDKWIAYNDEGPGSGESTIFLEKLH